jgi:hypothetical protein
MKKTIQSALAIVILAIPSAAAAAKPAANFPLTAKVHSTVVDEQNTSLFLGDPYACAGGTEVDVAALAPDAAAGVTTTAWNFFNWSPFPDVPAGVYDNRTFCGTGTCLRAEFNSSDKTFSLDTRVTGNPQRTFSVAFNEPWDLANDQPATHVPPWGPALSTAGLFEALASSSISQLAVCTNAACKEGREIQAKFWFTDPNNADVTWRLTWNHMRVLRVGPTTWYFLASACDGSQVAGLSRLEGSRTRPRETNQGYYLIPFFISADKK